MIDQRLDKKIGELVISNYLNVAVFHYFGINYRDHFDASLRQLAAERDLNLNLVISRLDQINRKTDFKQAIKDYPLDWVLAYLRHAHRTFVAVDLPFLADLIDDIEPGSFSNQAIAKDLKLIFPVFVDEFIHHIHEEEDTLFSYIALLLKAEKRPNELSRLLLRQNVSLSHLEEAHHHDDELSGIRELTGNFGINQTASIHEIVVMKALEAFDESLQIHASIEDEILFKQSIQLDQDLQQRISKLSEVN